LQSLSLSLSLLSRVLCTPVSMSVSQQVNVLFPYLLNFVLQ
jgi:hypothetical protein